MINLLSILEKIYAFLFMGVCILVVVTGSYWLYFQPSDILNNLDHNVIVNNSSSNIVEAGKPMTLTRSFCILNNKFPGEVVRTFTNHTVYQLPDTTTFTLDKGLGCHDKVYVVDVPSVLPTDTYEYRVRISYRINPLKTVSYDLKPVELHVVNPMWDKIKELMKE